MAGNRRFSAGSLPYTPYVPWSGTLGLCGMLDRIESKVFAGIVDVTARVTPDVS